MIHVNQKSLYSGFSKFLVSTKKVCFYSLNVQRKGRRTFKCINTFLKLLFDLLQLPIFNFTKQQNVFREYTVCTVNNCIYLVKGKQQQKQHTARSGLEFVYNKN